MERPLWSFAKSWREWNLKSRMLKLSREIAIWAFVVLAAASITGYLRAPHEAPPLEALSGRETIDGTAVSDILSGKKVVLLHFWGVWCPVCREELELLRNLSKNRDIILLTVAVGSGGAAELSKWMHERGVDFPVIADADSSLASKFGVEIYPTTLYYDEQKRFVLSDSGYTSMAGFELRAAILKK